MTPVKQSKLYGADRMTWRPVSPDHAEAERDAAMARWLAPLLGLGCIIAFTVAWWLT